MQNLLGLIIGACFILIALCGFAFAQVTDGRLAFVRGGDIYTADGSSGTNAVNLTNNAASDSNPAWSPDGRKIVFVSTRDHANGEIYVMNQDGSNVRRLTTDIDFDYVPSFSPDGTKIVFLSERNTFSGEIYVMNADGSNVVRLTTNTFTESIPVFSPDGTKILFSQNLPSTSLLKVHLMNADGSNPVQLTNGGSGSSFSGSDDSPSFSPDGTKIIFRRFDNGSFRAKFLTINPDGSGEAAVYDPQTNFPAILRPQYAPSGSFIYFDEQYQTNQSPTHRVRTLNGFTVNDAREPAWQPIRPVVRAKPFDFDGDGKTDISVYRPNSSSWWFNFSSSGQVLGVFFGGLDRKLVPADFTGDGRTDPALWNESTGGWYVKPAEVIGGGTYYWFAFGAPNDIPLASDFDGDGKADPTVFRPSTNEWFILKSTGGTAITTFGAAGDVPAIGDYDGDGRTDIAIYRPSAGEWWILRSSNGTNYAYRFGTATDKIVQGDYTGDGKTDSAIWREATGEWFILRSEDSSYYSVPFGAPDDLPVPGDYDGDGRIDTAVFRPADRTWYINRSTAGMQYTIFGVSTDIPIPSVFVQ